MIKYKLLFIGIYLYVYHKHCTKFEYTSYLENIKKMTQTIHILHTNCFLKCV